MHEFLLIFNIRLLSKLISFKPQYMEQQQKFDFGIIGGGVYGLSIAYHLAKSQKTVALFQRFTIGHNNGSSHGPQRITRSVYENQFYRDMNTLALKEYWPEMEQVLNSKFIYPNQFIWFDERKQQYEKFAKVAKSAKTKIQFMTSEQVCSRFPSMPYVKCSNKAIVDFEAGMIAADDYVNRLGEYLKTLPNIAIFQNTQIKTIIKNKKQIDVVTQTQIIRVQKVVVSSGRWVTQLLPELKDLFNISKQHLSYLSLQNPERYQFGRIPSFVYINYNTQYYTTPDRKGLGYKIGTHNLRKDTRQENIIQKQARQSHVQKAKQLFKQKFIKVNQNDYCYYTGTKSQQFIVDWTDPQDERILVCSCCSGHGFKFSPLMGKVISDILQHNRSIELFERYRYSCQILYHRGINLN